MQNVERHGDAGRFGETDRSGQFLCPQQNEQRVREISGAEQSDRDQKASIGLGQLAKTFAKRDVSYGSAMLFTNKKRDDCRGEDAGHERAKKENPEVLVQNLEKEQRAGRTDDRAERVHHALESESATVGIAIDCTREQRLANGRSHSASEPCDGAREQHMPCVCGETERGGTERGRQIADNGDRFSPFQSIGVITAPHLRKAGEPVRDTFDYSEPGRGDTEAREKGGHGGGRDLV